jgi:hypothetical protein
MKRLFGYPLYWYVGATLTLGLLGWVGVEQAIAQVSAGPMPGAIPQGPHRAKPAGPGACRLCECHGYATPEGSTRRSGPGAE